VEELHISARLLNRDSGGDFVEQFPRLCDEDCCGIQFADYGGRSCRQSFPINGRIAVRRVNNHRYGGQEFLENPCFLESIHERHGKVGHNQGGEQQSRFFDALAPVFALAADVKISFAREEFARALRIASLSSTISTDRRGTCPSSRCFCPDADSQMPYASAGVD
jgi:hypothetical protein